MSSVPPDPHPPAGPVYKVMDAADLARLERDRRWTGAPVDLADGFVHLSTAAQLEGTLARHFAGRTGLVLVAFDPARLGPALRWEPARGGALFPHLYAPLPFDAAIGAGEVRRDAEGRLRLPG